MSVLALCFHSPGPPIGGPLSLRVGADGAIIVADVRGDQVAPSARIATHIIKVRCQTSRRRLPEPVILARGSSMNR